MADIYDEISCAKYWGMTPLEFWGKDQDDKALMYAYYAADRQRLGVEAFDRQVRKNSA